MTDATHYRNELRKAVAGKPWIVAQDVLVGGGKNAKLLSELGASRVFVIGGSRGTGELFEHERVQYLELGVVGRDMMHGIRACEAALDDLPGDVIEQVDAFDPAHEARVVRALFSSGHPVAGRPVFGGRRPEWVALEDKTVIDAFWDAAGVARADASVVHLDEADAAAARLDKGAGTVWVADNRDGWHGGAHFLRWVRTAEDARAAHAFLGAHAERVRVMPFLDGVPCSIHGMVFDEQTIEFRPCEMMVLRVPGETRLAYAAAATFWAPRESDADAMRAVARTVGSYLKNTLDYRGCFTVDGVMTSEGFLPTELNPRYGAALAQLAGGVPDLPLYLLHLALVEGEPLDYRPDELRRLVIDSSLERPVGRAHRILEVEHEPKTAGLIVENGECRFAGDETPQIHVELGPATSGSILMLNVEPAFPIGPPLAPTIVKAFAFLDAEWDLGIGPLAAADDVR